MVAFVKIGMNMHISQVTPAQCARRSRARRYRATRSGLLVLALLLSGSLSATAHAEQAPRYQPEHGSQILWDRYGVAHVYAKSVPDLFYGFGWSMAKSHGDLLAKLYAEGRGRAAEYY